MRRFSINLAKATNKHIRLLYHVTTSKTDAVIEHINDYANNFSKRDITLSKFQTRNNPPDNFLGKWVSHLHKLRPIIYESDHRTQTLSFNLLQAHERQQKMCHYGASLYHKQISTLHINSMVDDYYRFLSLAAETNGILVPTMEIDLVWHAHLGHHCNYKQDVLNITGRFLDHDDTISNATLKEQKKKTDELWQSKYGTNQSNSSSCGVIVACGGYYISPNTIGCSNSIITSNYSTEGNVIPSDGGDGGGCGAGCGG